MTRGSLGFHCACLQILSASERAAAFLREAWWRGGAGARVELARERGRALGCHVSTHPLRGVPTAGKTWTDRIVNVTRGRGAKNVFHL